MYVVSTLEPSRSQRPARRTGLAAVAHATTHGFETSLAMVRLLRLARRDEPSLGVDYLELNRGTLTPAASAPAAPDRALSGAV